MFIKLYAIALPVFFVIDMLWLGLVATNFYRNQIGFLMRDDLNWVAALLFYFLFIVGLVVFVIAPAFEKEILGGRAFIWRTVRARHIRHL